MACFGRLTWQRLRRPTFLAAVPPAEWLRGGSSLRRRRGGPGPCVLGDCVDCLRARVLACSRVCVRFSCLYMSACVRVYARLREARSLRVSQQRRFDILGGDICSGLEVWLLSVICRAPEHTSPA